MQIKGKIFTIAGIVLVFGYFIMDSLRVPTASNSEAIIMVGNDTLGRDWGAQAAQLQQAALAGTTEGTLEGGEGVNPNMYGTGPLIDASNDPYLKEKFDNNNYSTEMSVDGREMIIDYNNPYGNTSFDEENANQDNILYNNEERYKTRHQTEVIEPQMRYKD